MDFLLTLPCNPGNGFFLSNCRIHVSSGPEWAWGNMPVAMLNNPTEEKVMMIMTNEDCDEDEDVDEGADWFIILARWGNLCT